MTALIVIIWTLIGLCAGAVLVGEFASTDPAGAGFAGLMFGGPIGALCGLLLGFAIAKFSDDVRRKRLLAFGSFAVLIGLPLAVWLFETWRTYDHLTTRPNTYGLSFQVRLPAGAPTPAGQKVGIALRSAKENPACDVYEHPHGLTREGEHLVVSAQCKIFFAVAQRTILVRIGDGPTLIFNARVKARPESATYSDWFPVDEIHDDATGQKHAPRPDEQFHIRYGAR